ncbi:LytR/AlgR family response regulator transcription factor [Clostridium intestinale]|jgi:DNA-binding LytR/AlgR family response regulator|uniref:Stage 0 sporulation protein A homolog n=2 Tax=Clostridium intestinale TaxID=36845 RepID=U2NQX3_9CLOT|nr:LytTR family DNA-binding domain-containing protein [Clostridium intestinale]ERK31548.1 two-component response regulator VirR-like protein [Clostridium intestinale URNW]QLY78643.1 response regulator transcription factor [Clostridium intestinale]
MINIAICDDIKEELDLISSYVSKIINNINIEFKISTFNDGEEFIEYVSSSKEIYDIVFLDIYMKFSNGINTAKKIREFDKECKIIFITSSKEHAIESYEVRALYYILKPIEEDKLKDAIFIAIEDLNLNDKNIVIKNKKGSYKIIYKDILYAESSARVVMIHLVSGQTISFYSKLKDFIELIQDDRFIRCHKSFVVNMHHVIKIEGNYIFMSGNLKIPISSVNSGTVKEKYFNYLLN